MRTYRGAKGGDVLANLRDPVSVASSHLMKRLRTRASETAVPRLIRFMTDQLSLKGNDALSWGGKFTLF